MSLMGQECFADVNGVRTRYFEQGTGPTVLLVHGGQIGSSTDACSAEDWHPVFNALARSFRVIGLDRLGHGYTDNPKSDDAYTMAASVEHVAGFLHAAGAKPCHLVGHSSGGFVAVRLALQHPDLVKSCVVSSGVALYPGVGRDHIVRNNPPQPLLSRNSIRWICERQFRRPEAVADAWIDSMLRIAGTERNRVVVRKMNDDGLKDKLYLPSAAKQLGPTHRQLLEKGMPCPTLLAWSLNDPVGDVANGRLLVEMFQQKQDATEVRYFNEAGHYIFHELPEAFALMLRHYISSYC